MNPIRGVDLPATLWGPEMLPAMITPWYRRATPGYQSQGARPDLSVAAGTSRVGECGRSIAQEREAAAHVDNTPVTCRGARPKERRPRWLGRCPDGLPGNRAAEPENLVARPAIGWEVASTGPTGRSGSLFADQVALDDEDRLEGVGGRPARMAPTRPAASSLSGGITDPRAIPIPVT